SSRRTPAASRATRSVSTPSGWATSTATGRSTSSSRRPGAASTGSIRDGCSSSRAEWRERRRPDRGRRPLFSARSRHRGSFPARARDRMRAQQGGSAMRRTVLAGIFGAAVSAAGLAGPAVEFPAERMYRVVDVGPGIVSFIAAETSGPIPSGNVTAVIGDDGVLVVDSGRFPTLAKRMIAEIKKRTDRPVRYLVHTHWHLDHIASDETFRAAFPRMAIVPTAFTRRKIAEKQVPYLKGLVETDRGYVEYLQGAVAKGKRRDGSAESEESKRYLTSQVSDIQLESAELAGVAAVIQDLTFDHEMGLQ